MRLSRVFGISPEYAAQLERANVRTLQDLANITNLAGFSVQSHAPLDLLEQWRASAEVQVAATRRRRKAISVLGVVTAVLLGTIAVWSSRLYSAVAHYNRGNALSEKGKYDTAISEYEKSIGIRSNYARVHNNLCIALSHKGDYAAAIAECQKALALKPDYAEAHYNLGNALDDKGDYDAAIAEYRKALALKPDAVGAHDNLGIVLHRKGDYDAAIAECQKALALKPGFADAHNMLGIVLRQKGDYDDAIA